jgi:hypothetical protein
MSIKKDKIVQLLFIFLLTYTFPTAQENDWQLLYSEQGIDVYTRTEKATGIEEYRAITTLNCRLEVIAIILKDFANYPNWMPDCLQAKLLEQTDADNLLLYYLHNSPSPLKNRDVVLNIQTKIDTNLKTLFINSVNVNDNRYPPQPDAVRMAKMETYWIIEAVDREHTHLSYRLLSDPSGWIPTSLAVQSIRPLPLKTLLGLRQMAQSERYIQAAKNSPEEKIANALFPK